MIEQSVEIQRRYNVAPGDEVLAVTTDREGAARGELLRWGLVPSWARSPATGLKMINARIETVGQRAAYRRPYERYRCLIVADGFYEWQPTAAGTKQPYHITRADGELFAFAGLWSIWYGENGSKLRTCAILTTPANSAVAKLHDRMPVILHPAAESAWIDSRTPLSELPGLLGTLRPEQTKLRPVGLAVNDARYDGPACLEPSLPLAQASLF